MLPFCPCPCPSANGNGVQRSSCQRRLIEERPTRDTTSPELSIVSKTLLFLLYLPFCGMAGNLHLA